MLAYQQAIKIINEVALTHKPKSTLQIKLSHSENYVLAHDVLSPINVPPFNNSAMDGFALQSELINADIRQYGQAKVKVTGSVRAGDESEIKVKSEENVAWEIMTGAPVPDVFDAVIPIENVDIIKDGDETYILISESIVKGRNIRKLGTDYAINQLVVKQHTKIQSQHIMALATVGISAVEVISKVKIAIVSTGNELAKKSTQSLNSGQIFNSNQPYIHSYCQSINCDPVFVGRCKDSSEDFNPLLDEALAQGARIIISTGAVSMGKYDFVPSTLLARGAKIHFHKVKIRPGKPLLFAELPNGVFYFGLPGNPIAAAAGMRFFVSPFLNKMMNLTPEITLKAKLSEPTNKKPGFRTFAKAKAQFDDEGQLWVNMLQDQGSYQSRSFAESNCWLILPENQENILKGSIVQIVPMVPKQLFIS